MFTNHVFLREYLRIRGRNRKKIIFLENWDKKPGDSQRKKLTVLGIEHVLTITMNHVKVNNQEKEIEKNEVVKVNHKIRKI